MQEMQGQNFKLQNVKNRAVLSHYWKLANFAKFKIQEMKKINLKLWELISPALKKKKNIHKLSIKIEITYYVNFPKRDNTFKYFHEPL